MIKILESILFFKIKQRFGWGVAIVNLLLDIQIAACAGLFGFMVITPLALFYASFIGYYSIEEVLIRTGLVGAVLFFLGILNFINDGSFKQTLLMSLGKIPWPEEQPSWFPGRKKELEYRPAPKQWTLEPKQDENKRGNHTPGS